MNERGTTTNSGFQLDITGLLLFWLRKWWLVLLLIALGGAASYYYTTEYVTPIYSASVTIYVNNSSSAAAQNENEYISGGNLSTAARLVATYSSIITSDRVLKNVVEQAGINISTSTLRNIMSASQVNDTEVFRVTVSNSDPQMAALIANTIADVAPAEIAEIIRGSSTRIIDYAQVPTVPVSPNVNRNIMMGSAAGVAAALVILTLIFLLDVRIKDEDDLSVICDLPVLGQLPDFSTVRSGKKDYGYDTGKSSGYSEKKAGGKAES